MCLMLESPKMTSKAKRLTQEDKLQLAKGREEIFIKAIDAYMFGDLFLHYDSNEHEESRRKKNPFIEIGKNVRIKSGTVIGGNGFGYTKNDEGHYIHREHSFKVIIGNDVDIGNNCTIDRGRWRDTEIGDGTKIDNQAHIAHNVIIGKDFLIHAHVNLCGSVEIGDGVEIYPLTNIHPGVKVCDGVTIGDGSIVREDINTPGTYVYGGHGQMRRLIK